MSPPFAALRAFDVIGRSGGIRKAADALGVSHAIVSRHLSGLELQLGVMLFNRQSGELTEAGRRYHERISAALSEIDAATGALEARRRRNLTIWCSAGFALHWLARRLPEFARGRNRPVIDLRSTDRAPEFGRDEADGDIRYQFDGGTPQPTGSRATKVLELARPVVFPVAAPELLARLPGPIERAADLRALPLIQESSEAEWAAWLKTQGDESGDLPLPVARYGQVHLALAAACAGQGIVLGNHYLLAELLESGRLVEVRPARGAWLPVALGAYVFRCSRARWSDPMLVRFRNWLRGQI